jgi:RNA polymerase sigma-70 factor (ECF subfamily)
LETIGTIGEMAVPREQTSSSFEQLVALHEPRVRRLAYRLLGWRDSDVDDIVQDVFLAAFKKLHGFRGESNIATWLASVTINRCRTHRRRQLLKFKWLRTARSQTFDERTNDNTSAAVRAAVQSLPARDREVIVLCYLEEMPISEIAKLLNVSRSVIDTRLSRARAKLKEELSRFVEP